MPKRTYTDDERSAAVALANSIGPTKASQTLGIASSAIRRWQTDHTLQPSPIIGQAIDIATQRRLLREELANAARNFVGKALASEKGSDAQGFMVAAGIAVDKLRLELGEHTSAGLSVQLGSSDDRLAALVGRIRQGPHAGASPDPTMARHPDALEVGSGEAVPLGDDG